jgi:hypothetical protein
VVNHYGYFAIYNKNGFQFTLDNIKLTLVINKNNNKEIKFIAIFFKIEFYIIYVACKFYKF